MTLWLPWVYFGSATRTSFGVFRSAQNLGLDELAPFRIAWFLLPVVALTVLVFVGRGRLRIAAGLLVALSLVLGLPALLVVLAGLSAWGSKLALAASGVGIAVGTATMVVRAEREQG